MSFIVKRCTGADNTSLQRDDEKERMLKASWDYWESRGLEHPLKTGVGGITPLSEEVRKGT